MTSRTVTVCDRCGEELMAFETKRITIKRLRYLDYDRDLCSRCAKDLKRLFDDWWKEARP